MFGAPIPSIALKYSIAHTACPRSPEAPHTTNAGGTLRGIEGAVRLRANGEGPGYTIPAKSGRDEIPASGSPAPPFFLSKSSYSTAAAAASSAPAEKPITPIFAGSRFHSLAYARTRRTACSVSYTSSVCGL